MERASSNGAVGNTIEKDLLLKFIRLYRQYPETWRVKSPEYKDKIKRGKAYDQLLHRYKYYKPSATLDEIKKKINVIRTGFRQENKKRRHCFDLGMEYKPVLWYYDELKFLEEQDDGFSAKGEPTDEVDMSDVTPELRIAYEDPFQQTFHEEPFMPHQDCYVYSEEENSVLTKGWAIKLNRMSRIQRLYAEKLITDILMEGELGNLRKPRTGFYETPTSNGPTPIAIIENCVTQAPVGSSDSNHI